MSLKISAIKLVQTALRVLINQKSVLQLHQCHQGPLSRPLGPQPRECGVSRTPLIVSQIRRLPRINENKGWYEWRLLQSGIQDTSLRYYIIRIIKAGSVIFGKQKAILATNGSIIVIYAHIIVWFGSFYIIFLSEWEVFVFGSSF